MSGKSSLYTIGLADQESCEISEHDLSVVIKFQNMLSIFVSPNIFRLGALLMVDEM